ncbi:MAG: HAMP domain-containing sensor histidine kinase, partial [Myxococcota bacterium]
MALPRISSFLQYALLALTAVLVPPSVALVHATLAVDELARSGSQTVIDAARTVDLARAVAEHVTAMERLARQRRVLGDDELGALYETRRREFVEIAGSLAALDLPAPVEAQLTELRDVEDTVHRGLSTQPTDSVGYADAIDRFAELSTDARQILFGSIAANADAAMSMQIEAQALERRLIIEMASVVPLVLGLLLLAVIAIVRPLRALDEAIRTLGSGDLDREIAIRGPTDVKSLGTRLEWLRQRLLALETDRVRLLRHVSHELKTPLTCIREGTQLLDDGVTGDLTPDQREITAIIAANAAELTRRIEDLLRASDLRREEAALDLKPVALVDVIRQVLHQNAVAARARQIKLDPVLVPVEVVGDPLKLRTVVDNLITNAIKFSPERGTVLVTLGLEGGDVVIAVEDEGPGFDPTERERVFEAFYQGQATWIRHVGGTGLGLAIAREYVRAHGGDIHVENGRTGARVVVRVPG